MSLGNREIGFAEGGLVDMEHENCQIRPIREGRSKKKSEYCVDNKSSLRYLRANVGHSGGIPIVPELMGYTSIPYSWKDFLSRPIERIHQVLSATRTSSPRDVMALSFQFNRRAHASTFCIVLSHCWILYTACMSTMTVSTRRIKKSILESGLSPGGRENDKARQAVFTLLNFLGEHPDLEKPC